MVFVPVEYLKIIYKSYKKCQISEIMLLVSKNDCHVCKLVRASLVFELLLY